MARRGGDSLETALLIIELLRRIPARRKISASELQAQLNEAGYPRDIRTIQRLLNQLTTHFAIERDTHKPFGYRWREKARGFVIPQLSEHESLLLLLAQRHLNPLLPPSITKSMEGFFAQASTNLYPSGLHPSGKSSARLARQWLEKVRVVSQTQPLLPPEINTDIFQTVSAALYLNRWLFVQYKNALGNIIKADIMPLGLAQQGPRLYLVCRFKGFDNERSLAIHRLLKARAGDKSFARPAGFSLRAYDESGRFGFSEGQYVRLSFDIRKDAGLHLLESPLSSDQQVKETRHYYKITASVMDSWQLTWWLSGFGSNVRNVKRRKMKRKGSAPRGGG